MSTILLAVPPARLDRVFPLGARLRLQALGSVALLGPEADEDPLAWTSRAERSRIVVVERNLPVPAAALARLPSLVAVVRTAVDVRNVDVEAATARGILVVHGTPGWVDAVCELLLGSTIALLRHIPSAILAYRRGVDDVDLPIGRQLAGSTVGIIGYGTLGRRMAEIARFMHAEVVVHDPFAAGVAPGVARLDLPKLLAVSDVVVCLAAHTAETEQLLDAAAIAAMKPGAVLVNGARGALVDEAALEVALERGALAGAVLDVGSEADERPNRRLAAREDVIATPHVGGLVREAIDHHAGLACEQVEAILNGRRPVGALNWEAAYRVHDRPRPLP